MRYVIGYSARGSSNHAAREGATLSECGLVLTGVTDKAFTTTSAHACKRCAKKIIKRRKEEGDEL